MQEVTIITDGSCPNGNPGPGGWAALLLSEGREAIVTGCHPATTNNRAELMGAIDGLRALKVPCHVSVVTDSQYLKQGMTEWLPRWKANAWRSSSGKPVLNQDLWLELAELAERHEVEWSWSRGHTKSNKDKDRVDQLAARAAREQTTRALKG